MRIKFPVLAALLGLCLVLAGCTFMYAPPGNTPGELQIKASGKITQAMIKQAVFEQVGSLMDQPSPDHWLGPPTWQVNAYLLAKPAAIWPLRPISGLSKPKQGMSADGFAIFEVPSGTNRFRITWACTVTHFWSEGGTWQEPVGVYLRQKEMTITVPPSGVVTIYPFGGSRPK